MILGPVLKVSMTFTVVMLMVEGVQALDCSEKEYEQDNRCCARCEPGKRVHTPCTDSKETDCILCTEETYMDRFNGLNKCLPCKQCDSSHHLEVIEPCTLRSNRKCGCKSGSYCKDKDPDGSCDLCSTHTVCKPGQRVGKNGTAENDTFCKPCEDGTFSDQEMSQFCKTWTRCSNHNKVIATNGSLTSDVTCKDKPPYLEKYLAPVVIVLIALVGFIVLVLVIIPVWRCDKKRRRRDSSGPELRLFMPHPGIDPD
ncbi:tumor necrosis factor receptor superfamily member 14-like [Latimeria chalumnae]|uniref:tumor necrosis factor receptor superfamily member 14-like n=1 Tax=Latimeria chalumnae TaxID=7897 RepID=UPI00313AABE7